MKATTLFLGAIAAIVLLLASCASERARTSDTPAPTATAAPAREVSLTNATGDLRLTVPAEAIGPIRLEAFGDTLIASALPPVLNNDVPWLRAGGETFSLLNASSPVPAAALRSNDWQYVRFDGATAAPSVLKSARRHLLLVEPDIVVVLDELVLSNSVAVELHVPSVNSFERDAVRDEWNLHSGRGGVTARLLALPVAAQSWIAPAASAAGALRSVVAESGPELHHLAIFAVHTNQARRSLAFKLLESDTAIGARIHRDGLPTLVAFRKASCVGEANLTGLKFTAPLAVDVFRPKRRK